MKRYKLIKQTSDKAWKEENGNPMKIGRVVSENEIINESPMSYWIEGQEQYWEEVLVDEDGNEYTEWSDSDSAKLDKALRYNEGKPQFSLIDLNSMEDCAKVLEFGANKYSRNNWQKGFPLSTILDSMLRHIAALQRGEMIDPESGLPHTGHIQCNALFLGCKNNTNDFVEKECCGDWDSDGNCKCDKI